MHLDDINVDDLVKSINLDKGLIEGLLQLDRDKLTVVLADIANKGKINTANFKKARVDLPSSVLSQPPDIASRRHCMSTCSKMLGVGWTFIRRSLIKQEQEARARILDPYLVPIVALFHGRAIDMPEQTMQKTKYSTGGEVEHEIFVIGGAVFFVIECKYIPLSPNALAQLFIELLSAAAMNKSIDFAGLRIYGLLTDLIQFKFYSIALSSDMMDVSNKIFGVVLSAYMESLRANILQSKGRVKPNNVKHSILFPEKLAGNRKSTSGRKSTDRWKAALLLAESCCEKFEEPLVSVEDIEYNANEALESLTKSVRSNPRLSVFTGGDDDPSTPGELKELATRVVKETHEGYFSKLDNFPPA